MTAGCGETFSAGYGRKRLGLTRAQRAVPTELRRMGTIAMPATEKGL